MVELDVTWTRVFAVYWLCLWRSLVVNFLIAVVIGLPIGLITNKIYFESGGTDFLTAKRLALLFTLPITMPLGFCWVMNVFRMALKKKYHDFRIVLISNGPQLGTSQRPAKT